MKKTSTKGIARQENSNEGNPHVRFDTRKVALAKLNFATRMMLCVGVTALTLCAGAGSWITGSYDLAGSVVQGKNTDLYLRHAKCLIGHGWDLLDATTDDVYRNRAKFAATGLDGILMPVDGRTRDGVLVCGREVTYSNRYDFADFAASVGKLREMTALGGLGESLAMTFLIPKKRLAWDDDARWATVANNFSVLARVAKAGGLKGVAIDHEDYWKAKQFCLFPSDPPRTHALARKRGREVFGAIFSAFPEARILGFWMLSDDGALWKEFLTGMLDVMPSTATFVEGNENYGYEADALKDDFRKDVWYMTRNVRDADIVCDLSLRAKYDLRMSVSFGQYVDMYTRTRYPFEALNGSKLERFEDNLSSAVRYSDDCVWVYGEQGCWVDWDEKRTGNLSYPTWEKRLPGFARTLRIAAGDGAAIEPEIASGVLVNLLSRPECDPTKDGRVAHGGWSKLGNVPIFLNEPNDGYPTKNCLKLTGDGCFCLAADGLKAKEPVYVRVWTKGVGGYVGFHWQMGQKKFFHLDRGRFLPSGRTVGAWKEIFFRLRVPENADRLNVTLSGPAEPESPILFDHLGIFVRSRRRASEKTSSVQELNK